MATPTDHYPPKELAQSYWRNLEVHGCNMPLFIVFAENIVFQLRHWGQDAPANVGWLLHSFWDQLYKILIEEIGGVCWGWTPPWALPNYMSLVQWVTVTCYPIQNLISLPIMIHSTPWTILWGDSPFLITPLLPTPSPLHISSSHDGLSSDGKFDKKFIVHNISRFEIKYIFLLKMMEIWVF